MIRKNKTGNLLSADFRALLYLYSAALRSFDSAAIIQIIVSLTYSFFSAQDDEKRRTTPFEPVEPTEPAEPLSYAIKGQHARGANPEL